MLRKIMIILALAHALGGYALATPAFAGSSTLDGGRMMSGSPKAAHRGGRSVNDYDYELNGYDYRHAGSRRAYEWDPWGHWGAYYGPNPAPL
jgi:hypothetical protein